MTRETGTPGTVGTAETMDTASEADDEEQYDLLADDQEEEKKDEGDQVLTLEIGGETPEEREKRIALALRK